MPSNWQLTREMFLSFEEVDQLLAGIRSPAGSVSEKSITTAFVDRMVVESLLFSGLKTTEFCHLTVADTMVGQGTSVFVVQGLRGRDRTIYIPSEVSELVQRYVSEFRPRFLPDGVDAGDLSQPLLFSKRKNPVERTGLYRRVVRVLTASGLGDRASVQLLRHTYGYMAYARTGGNLLFVQQQLGHAHPMVTSVYAQFVDQSYDQLVERVFESNPKG